MENNRTIAFQVSEELYRRIKDYLTANQLTQKEFMIGLIEDALEQEITEEEAEKQECEDEEEAEDVEQEYDESEEAEDEDLSPEMGM